jgi:3-mercaptopyruvate sulfurtransferase SseA
MERNSLYIDLKEVLKEHKQKLCVNPQTIRKVLEELKIDEEDEVIVTGDFVDWGWFCNLLLSQVLEDDIEGVV